MFIIYRLIIFSPLAKLIIGTSKAWIRGKALSTEGHTHSASNITSGTLPLARGGTGVTSISALKSALGISSSGGDVLIKEYTLTNPTAPNYGNTTGSISLDKTPKLVIFAEGADRIVFICGSSGECKTYSAGYAITFIVSNRTITLSGLGGRSIKVIAIM